MKSVTDKIIFLTIVFVTFFTLRCQKEANNSMELIIAKETFISLYTESLIIKYSDYSFEIIDSLLVKLYKKYALTEEKYKQIENYFKENPREWLEILPQTDEKIKEYSKNSEVKVENQK